MPVEIHNIEPSVEKIVQNQLKSIENYKSKKGSIIGFSSEEISSSNRARRLKHVSITETYRMVPDILEKKTLTPKIDKPSKAIPNVIKRPHMNIA